MSRRPLLGLLLLVASVPPAGARAIHGYSVRCPEGSDGVARVVQGRARVRRDAALVAHLEAFAKTNRMLNGAVVKGALTLSPPATPDAVGVQATVTGTARLRNGTVCRMAGDAFGARRNRHPIRWSGFELAIRCPDGATQALGIFDERIVEPYGNGGGVPADELCTRLG